MTLDTRYEYDGQSRLARTVVYERHNEELLAAAWETRVAEVACNLRPEGGVGCSHTWEQKVFPCPQSWFHQAEFR